MDARVAEEFLESSAAVVAVGRLISLKLVRRFPALVAYLSLLAVSNTIYGILSPQSRQYFWVYVALVPFECILGIIAVRELVALIFKNYPGIRTVGRWAMYAGVVLATGVSLALTKFFWQSGAHRAKWGVYYLEVSQRSIVFTLAVVILAILFALSKYPLHLGKNTYVSIAFFSALFLSEAVGLLVDSLASHFYNHFVDEVELVFISACLAGWALLLQPEAAPVARVAFSTLQEDQLLHQLDSLNQFMSRAAKR
jgi:hypothetical protein